MKFVELVCPYCRGQLELCEDREFAVCIHCNHKVMVVDDEAKAIDASLRQTDIELEDVIYLITNADVPESIDKCFTLLDTNREDAHAWVLRGYIQLIGYEVPEERDSKFKMFLKNITDSAKPERVYFGKECYVHAESSWRKAFSLLNNQYYLSDYSALIGISLGQKIDGCNQSEIEKLLSNIIQYIEKRFNISYTSDFYSNILSNIVNHHSSFYSENEFEFIKFLLIESLKCDPSPESFIQKCRRFQKWVKSTDDVRFIDDVDNTIGLLGYTVYFVSTKLTREDYSNIHRFWSEQTLKEKLDSDWDELIDSWNECDEGYSDAPQYSELKDIVEGLFVDQVDVSEDEYEDEVPSDDESEWDDEGYERIEELETTLSNKLKKERAFIQYLIIDGHHYSRTCTFKKKEFDGSVDTPADLEILKAMFDEAYEDISEEDFDVYYDDEEDCDDQYDEDDTSSEMSDEWERVAECTARLVSDYLRVKTVK